MQGPPPNCGAQFTGGGRPLSAASALADFIRIEHGRDGVRRYLAALNPLLPREFLVELCSVLGESPPPPYAPPIPVERDEKRPSGPNPQELMLLMQALNGSKEGGGLDPKLLLKLMQQKKD